MTKLIVSAYAALLDAILLAVLLGGIYAAYNLIPDAPFKEHDLYPFKTPIKIALGLLATFAAEVLVFGPFLLLEDIRRSVRIIERRNNAPPADNGAAIGQD